jgi:hypothetical protein
MFAAGSSPLPDPFVLLDKWDRALVPSCNRNPDSYTQVNPNLVAGETTCVIIAGGQSTITNCGTGSYTKTNTPVHMLNIYSGGMYSAINAMIGVDGSGENFLIRLADKMINAAKYERIILVPFGLGSTPIVNWAVGASGFCNERISVACQRVSKMGLLAADQVYVIWQHGESDQVLGTSQGDYTTRLASVISTVKTSYVSGNTSSAVRAAQTAAVTGTVFAGPDTDTLNSSNRYDNIHWNATGADAVAGLWNGVLA